MLPKRTCVALFYTLAALHCSNGQATNEKRSRAVWYRARDYHNGVGLSDAELQELSALAGDLDQFKTLLRPIMVPRIVGTQGHADVRRHLVDTMQNLKWDVQEDAFDDHTPSGRKTFTNVIATLNPSAPRQLVLACHYDSKIDDRGDFIGATDSAVPCAMLLHLATQLHTSLETQKKENADLTLQFIFFDGEEAFVRWTKSDSLYGSRNMAAKLHNQLYPPGNSDKTNHLQRMDLLVLLDLIGTEDVTFYNYFKDTERWYARMVSYEMRLDALNLLNPRKPMFKTQSMLSSGIQDDHIPFLRRGVPVLHIIPVPFPSVWHTLRDDARALHYPTIDNFNRILFAFTADYLHLLL